MRETPGWKLVPIEPDDAMRIAASKLIDFCAAQNYGAPPAADDLWSVMVEAAPEWRGEDA